MCDRFNGGTDYEYHTKPKLFLTQSRGNWCIGWIFWMLRKALLTVMSWARRASDKLIYLITSDKQQIIKDLCNPLNDVNSSLLETMHFRENFEEICTLSCTTDPQTEFLKLTATNTKNGKTLAITPKLFDENDSEEWGVCISPLMFNHLARVLSLVYTTETHERICSIFAKGNYNDENYPIPAFYKHECKFIRNADS